MTVESVGKPKFWNAKKALRRLLLPALCSLLVLLTTWLVYSSGSLDGVLGKDDLVRRLHSSDLISHYGICGVRSKSFLPERGYRYHATGWEIFLGVMQHCVFTDAERYQLRHSLTFGLYLFSVVLSTLLLVKVGVSPTVALLALAIVASNIRFGGHSIFNVKDGAAASIWLFVSVSMWFVWHKLNEVEKSSQAFGLFVLLGVLAVAPYLARTPLLFHFVVSIFMVLQVSVLFFRKRQFGLVFLGLATPVSGLLCIFLFYPITWYQGLLSGIVGSLRSGLSYEVRSIKFFNLNMPSDDLPWWFPLPWPVVQYTWLASILLVFLVPSFISIMLYVWDILRKKEALSFSKDTFWVYVWGIFLAPLFAVLVMQPALYEQERHILFLYPLTGFLMAHGLAVCTKYIPVQRPLLSVLILSLGVTSFDAYSQWGRFSYTHENSILQKYFPRTVKGSYKDYFELIIPLGVDRAIQDHGLRGNFVVRFQGLSGFVARRLRELGEPMRSIRVGLEIGNCGRKVVYVGSMWKLRKLLQGKDCRIEVVEKISHRPLQGEIVIARVLPSK